MEENKKDEKLEACLARIRELVAKTVEEMKNSDWGKKMIGKDYPVARCTGLRRIHPRLTWPESRRSDVPPGTDRYEILACRDYRHDEKITSEMILFTGSMNVSQAGLEFPAFETAREMLEQAGLEEDGHLFSIFHFVIEKRVLVCKKEYVLVEVHKHQDGTFSKRVTFPGGYLFPGDKPLDFAKREIYEAGIKKEYDSRVVVSFSEIFPSLLLLQRRFVTGSQVKEVRQDREHFCAWVSKRCFDYALIGDYKPMVSMLRKRGLDVPDNLEFMPADAEAAKVWGYGRF